MLSVKNQTLNIECRVGLKEVLEKEVITTKTLLCIDEADYCLLHDGKLELPKTTKVKAIIAFSASVPTNGIEKYMVYTHYNFTVVDTRIKGTLTGNEARPCTFNDFIKDKSFRPKLVFTDDKSMETYKEYGSTHGWHVNVNTEDLDLIRNLTTRRLLIVTKEILMRGVDYRSTKGIDLFIDVPLSSRNSFIQALGRVGRCADECTRSINRNLTKGFEEE